MKHYDIMNQKVALRGRLDKESQHESKLMTSASIMKAQYH